MEEYGEDFSELVHLMEGMVSAKRFKELVEKSENEGFDFLTIKERRNLEKAIAQEALKSNMENGICYVAYQDVLASQSKFRFEAYIEVDGACGDLMTPYDYRDGKFKNLDDCVTKSWSWG